MSNTQAPAQPRPKFDPENPDKTTTRRCRSLTVAGIQCKQAAMNGFDYCVAHFRRGPVAFEKGLPFPIPLLEDASAVRLTCTKIAHGILNELIPPERANPALRACKIAAFTLPRPARSKTEAAPDEAISNYWADEYGDWIGPREAYLGPTGTFAPQWSVSKYIYEQQCEQAGKPKPKCAADFPPEGWLTEEEIKEQQTDEGIHAMMKRYEKKLAEIERQRAVIEAEETKAALDAGLPDPHAKPKSSNPNCPYGITWCKGLRHRHHCGFCSGFTKMKLSDPRYPGDEAVARVATLREFLAEKKQKEEQAAAAPSTGQPASPAKEESQPSARTAAEALTAATDLTSEPQTGASSVCPPLPDTNSAPDPQDSPEPNEKISALPPLPLTNNEADPQDPPEHNGQISALHSSAAVEERAFRPASAASIEARASAPERPAPEPGLDLEAVAETRSTATGPHFVVESVNIANPLIAGPQKSVAREKQTLSPPKAKTGRCRDRCAG